MVAFQDDQGHHAGHHEAKVDRKIGGYSDEEASLAANVFALVGSFGATCSTGGIFTFLNY